MEAIRLCHEQYVYCTLFSATLQRPPLKSSFFQHHLEAIVSFFQDGVKEAIYILLLLLCTLCLATTVLVLVWLSLRSLVAKWQNPRPVSKTGSGWLDRSPTNIFSDLWNRQGGLRKKIIRNEGNQFCAVAKKTTRGGVDQSHLKGVSVFILQVSWSITLPGKRMFPYLNLGPPNKIQMH